MPWDCWASNPHIKRFMKKQGMGSESELQSYFISRVLHLMAAVGKEAVVWQEVFDAGQAELEPGTIVQVSLLPGPPGYRRNPSESQRL